MLGEVLFIKSFPIFISFILVKNTVFVKRNAQLIYYFLVEPLVEGDQIETKSFISIFGPPPPGGPEKIMKKLCISFDKDCKSIIYATVGQIFAILLYRKNIQFFV